jgi:hypothetical protein
MFRVKEPDEYWDEHCEHERVCAMMKLPEAFKKLIESDKEAKVAFEYVGKDLDFHWNKRDDEEQLELVFKALVNHDHDLLIDYPKTALLQFRDDLERENYDAGSQD